DWPGRRLIRTGFLVVAAGIACEAAALRPEVPVAVALAGWAVGGFGIGLAYSPISLIVLGEARSGQEGAASAALQLTETLGVALGAGLGGVLVAAGAAAGWLPRSGLAGAFALTAAVALGAAVLARRIPSRTIPAPDRPGG
ncbi:MAG TPA: MFS transporter, partial [Actinomycetes bacterium]|nr:MFS transporter [Actinomycetes bacterium]